MNTVLFACVHNAGRSQMAAALFNRLADPSKARAISDGTQPGPEVYPEVRQVLHEIGIALDVPRPRLLTPEVARQASVLVTMGCGEFCPVVPGVKRQDWPLTDPKGLGGAQVRSLRARNAESIGATLEEAYPRAAAVVHGSCLESAWIPLDAHLDHMYETRGSWAGIEVYDQIEKVVRSTFCPAWDAPDDDRSGTLPRRSVHRRHHAGLAKAGWGSGSKD